MKAIIKKGKQLLFLEGASGQNLEDLRNELILNLNEKWTFLKYKFRQNTLIVDTTEGEVVIVFSSFVRALSLSTYEKDQLVFDLIRPFY